jgi:uncharacterized iron-regulated protein
VKKINRFKICLLGLVGAVLFTSSFAANAPLAGRIWSVHDGRFVPVSKLVYVSPYPKIVLLGETHDNKAHHELQLRIVEGMVADDLRPALVMEQFDRDFQDAITLAQERPDASTESILDAGHFNRQGWQVEYYRPLVALALKFRLPIIAGNLSREDALTIIRDKDGHIFPEVSKDVEDALAEDILQSHGTGMPPDVIAGMVRAQRARDIAMAKALERYADRGAVLIAGIAHVRRDRGVPMYLSSPVMVIGFIGVHPLRKLPLKYLDGKYLTMKSLDYLWFTDAQLRDE